MQIIYMMTQPATSSSVTYHVEPMDPSGPGPSFFLLELPDGGQEVKLIPQPRAKGPGRPKKAPVPGALPLPKANDNQRASLNLPNQPFFGAIIITRPYVKQGIFNIYHTCTINPPVIGQWLGDNPSQVLSDYILGQSQKAVPSPHAEHKRIDSVHSFTIENKLAKASMEQDHKGISTATWTEPGSATSFTISTPTW